MIEIGRLCVKIAGRDAGGKCVIVDVLDDKFVMVDGQVRRRKCNIAHLEPLNTVLNVKKGASHDSVKKEFDALKLDVWNTKPRKAGERPKKLRCNDRKAEEAKEEPKGKKKAAPKKAEKKTEAKPAKKAKASESVEELLGDEEKNE